MAQYQLVLCTTVLAGDLRDPVNAVRLQLAYGGAALATELDIPLVVVVGDSGQQGEEVLEEFGRLGAIAVPQAHTDDPRTYGMYVSRQQCLREGLNLDADLYKWVEPEKVKEILRGCNRARLLRAARFISGGEIDAMTPYCPEMNGYPTLQRDYEQGADAQIAAITGLRPYDAYRGPFGGNKRTIEVMLSYYGEYGNKHQTTCVLQQLRCLAAGLKVGVMPFPEFWYPHAQRVVEDGDPRIVSRRVDQQHLIEANRSFVNDQKAAGLWPPPGEFIELA